MTRQIVQSAIAVSRPHTANEWDFEIDDKHIHNVNWSVRAGKPLDTGSIVLDNRDGRYTTTDYGKKLDIDDKLDFRVSWEGDSPGRAFGVGPFGEGTFGGDPVRYVGKLIVSNWYASGYSWNSILELDVETFVFNRLNAREVRVNFDDAQISGTSDSILNTVLREFVPDVDRSLLPDITETIDYYTDGKRANTVIDELATRARVATGDAYITAARGNSLLFKSLADVESIGTFTSGSTSPDFKGTPEHASAADDLVNEMRVEGGIDDVGNIDEEQTTQDQFTTVTDGSPVTYQLAPSKPEITRVEAKIRHVTGSEDDLVVRLHPDASGSPRNLSDTDLDFTSGRKEVPEDFDGTLRINLGEHVLGPNDTPWLIFEASDSDGVDVGTDSVTGEPWFKTHFSKPVIVEVPDSESKGLYRIHEDTIENDNIQSFNAARDRAKAELKRRGLPRLKFGPISAESERAHELKPGEAITLPFTHLRADDDYICTKVDYTYEESTLETELEFMGFERYA